MSAYGTEKSLRHLRMARRGWDLMDVIRSHVRLCGWDDAEQDVAEAVYWFACDWYSGQGDPLYAAQCQSPYRPGPCTSGPEPESAAEMIYQDLLSAMESD